MNNVIPITTSDPEGNVIRQSCSDEQIEAVLEKQKHRDQLREEINYHREILTQLQIERDTMPRLKQLNDERLLKAAKGQLALPASRKKSTAQLEDEIRERDRQLELMQKEIKRLEEEAEEAHGAFRSALISLWRHIFDKSCRQYKDAVEDIEAAVSLMLAVDAASPTILIESDFFRDLRCPGSRMVKDLNAPEEWSQPILFTSQHATNPKLHRNPESQLVSDTVEVFGEALK